MRVGCLDCETSGLNVETDRICEFAIIVWDTEQAKEVIRYRTLVQPGVHLSATVVAIHGITDADVLRAPTFKSIAGSIASLIGKLDLVVAHNGRYFDMPLIVHELVRAGVTLPVFPPVFDTMLEGRGCTDDGKVPNLGELCWALDVPYDKEVAHAALYDVEVNLQAFLRGVELSYWSIPEPAKELAAA